MKITIRQLAEYCNVSKGTIDRVINDKPGVKAQTRERVRRAAEELGYTPHYLAQSLARGKTRSIGIILLNLYNPFFAELSDACVYRAAERGYMPYLMLSQKSTLRETECVRNLISRSVDGIVLFSTCKDADFLDYLRSCDTPIVTPMTPIEGFPNVGVDDYSAMRDAARFALEREYRRFIYVSPPLSYVDVNTHASQERYRGFQKAVREADVEYDVITKYDYLQRLMDLKIRRDHKTAILCSSDIYAVEIIKHFKKSGLYPPLDYGIMGFDNVNLLRYSDPILSTVDVDIEKVGIAAVNLLVDIIEGAPAEDIILPYRLICGQTIC